MRGDQSKCQTLNEMHNQNIRKEKNPYEKHTSKAKCVKLSITFSLSGDYALARYHNKKNISMTSP